MGNDRRPAGGDSGFKARVADTDAGGRVGGGGRAAVGGAVYGDAVGSKIYLLELELQMIDNLGLLEVVRHETVCIPSYQSLYRTALLQTHNHEKTIRYIMLMPFSCFYCSNSAFV